MSVCSVPESVRISFLLFSPFRRTIAEIKNFFFCCAFGNYVIGESWARKLFVFRNTIKLRYGIIPCNRLIYFFEKIHRIRLRTFEWRWQNTGTGDKFHSVYQQSNVNWNIKTEASEAIFVVSILCFLIKISLDRWKSSLSFDNLWWRDLHKIDRTATQSVIIWLNSISIDPFYRPDTMNVCDGI